MKTISCIGDDGVCVQIRHCTPLSEERGVHLHPCNPPGYGPAELGNLGNLGKGKGKRGRKKGREWKEERGREKTNVSGKGGKERKGVLMESGRRKGMGKKEGEEKG